MSSPVRVSVQIQPQHTDFDGMRRAWREADSLGVDTIFIWDHFYPLYGDPDGKHFECLTSLAAMAEVTEHARIGPLVICNTYRNPQLLADAMRTIDHISGGRAVLGIGAGWWERDYDEYGYEFGTLPDRLRALRRDLPLIRERLRKLNPPPVGPLPILIGGGGEKMTLRLVAEHANMWHAFGDAEIYRRKSAVLAEHCAAIGRDPDEIERCWDMTVDLLDDAPSLAEAGVQNIVLALSGSGHGHDLGPLRELLAWRDDFNRGRTESERGGDRRDPAEPGAGVR
jgi:probable F420-dependent oxidoreductase